MFVIGSFFEIGLKGGFFIKNFVLLIEYVMVLKFNIESNKSILKYVLVWKVKFLGGYYCMKVR